MPGFHEAARPGVILSELDPAALNARDGTLRAVETALASPFFSAVQTGRVKDAGERRRIGEAAAAAGAALTYCAAGLQYERRLNLASLEAGRRAEALEGFRAALEEAREQGAARFFLIGGTAPENPARRVDAIKALADSLDALCETAAAAPAVTVVVEPLDVGVHKNGALGYTTEAVALAETLRATRPNFGLCLDTSHMTLNREDPAASLLLARRVTEELHLCNCCIDPAHPLHGDRHIPLGPPGPLDAAGAARMLAAAAAMGFLAPAKRPPIFHEVDNRNVGVEEAVRRQIAVLSAAWEAAQAMGEAGPDGPAAGSRKENDA